MEQRKIKAVAVQQRRDMHPVLNLEPAVALLRIEAPDFLAFEIKTDKFARAGEGIDVLAVGARRRGCLVPLVVAKPSLARGEFLLPKLFAGSADAKEHNVVAVFAGQKDAITPDYRRGTTHPWQWESPHDVLGIAPFGRKAAFAALAVVIGPAPLRPVAGVSSGNARKCDNECDSRQTSDTAAMHGWIPAKGFNRWSAHSERWRVLVCFLFSGSGVQRQPTGASNLAPACADSQRPPRVFAMPSAPR